VERKATRGARVTPLGADEQMRNSSATAESARKPLSMVCSAAEMRMGNGGAMQMPLGRGVVGRGVGIRHSSSGLSHCGSTFATAACNLVAPEYLSAPVLAAEKAQSHHQQRVEGVRPCS